MASFHHSVRLPVTAEEAFPWLLEEDKVPRWTGALEAYEVLGGGSGIGEGTRIRQVLAISGQRLEIELHVTRFEPPRFAESRFETNGLEVVTTYTLAPDGDAGSELTQTLDGKSTSFKARMLMPVVQPKLERKLTEDLERLRALLASA